jgi:hypothetical protein
MPLVALSIAKGAKRENKTIKKADGIVTKKRKKELCKNVAPSCGRVVQNAQTIPQAAGPL